MTGEELVDALRARGAEIERWWVYGAFTPDKNGGKDRYDGLRLSLGQIEVWPGGMRKATQKFIERELWVSHKDSNVEYFPDSLDELARQVEALLADAAA